MKHLIALAIVSLSMHSAYCQGQLQQEVSGSIAFTSGKVMQLADAIPEAKLSWAPSEGVRSFRDVLAHIVSANYFFGSKLGAAIPADVNMQTLEKDLKTKAQIKSALKDSYDFAINAVRNTKDDVLPNKVEYPFPGKFTNMTSILILLQHSNEHLGQLIAYSRMNGIQPPWSE